ncbi:adenylate/guanylate cyclase domain-containing protein [Aureimonas leprariae]|uniref:Adenylate/guanylate cyclase domain-containing protein n=1 Tax=Plantimonas leprariae TaxID=2615207 RepID=A0A7V7U1R0_9HYPH|nr:adenylate/guanylate cyclase domain-containing protein [Aureimonas leprariae]KAB0682553.1 adenylate/guanylate cyclase domain-containing protein [Aureimonas leprariae]
MSAAAARPTLPDILAWIVSQGLSATEPEAFLAGLGSRIAGLVPLDRLSIGVPTLDPNTRGASVTWTSDGAVRQDFSAYGPEGEAEFRKSPIYYARENDLMQANWNLGGGEGLADFPLLATLAADGLSHYALRLFAFPNEPYINGMALSFATRRSNGFSSEDHAVIDALLPTIALAVYRILLSEISSEMLRVYVGPRTSERVLAGAVHRNEGEAIEAAILFADLKGFTELSEAHPAEMVVGLLNEHFDVLDAPIAEHGGEILKFLGDGLLAVFPLDGDGTAACGRALRAAHHALVATAELNRLRAATGRPAIDLDIALHVGEVFYGNVGAARRLDFTVIGAAVNLASRIEQLCDRLGRNLVLSESFARQCGVPAVPLGRFELKGIRAAQAVFGIDGGE